MNTVAECTIPVDIVLRSSDHVLIGAHKANLSQFSGGFPPVDTVTETGRIVDLSKDGKMLSLLMRFMHIQRYPDLIDNSDYRVLALAYAAEKYVVPSAAAVSSARIL